MRPDVISRQLALLSDPDPWVRAVAQTQVASRADNPNVPIEVRESVLRALAPGTSIADRTGEDLPCRRARWPLRCRLRSDNPQVRGDAIRLALGAAHVPLLVALLGDPFTHYESGLDWSEGRTVGDRASEALARHGSAVVRRVIEVLESGSAWARRDAAACLLLLLTTETPARLGAPWDVVVSALVDASRSEDPLLVLAATNQPVHARALLDRQIALLRADSEFVRINAWQVLDRQRRDPRWSDLERSQIASHLHPDAGAR